MANQRVSADVELDLPKPETLWPVRLVSAIALLNGLFAILEVLSTRFSVRLAVLLPVDYVYYGRLFGLFAGFLLIYFSSRLLKRKRLAWWIAFIASILIVIDHGLFARRLFALILPSASLVLMAVYYDQFQVKSEPYNLRQGLKLLLLSVLVALAYGTIGFTKLLPRDFNPPQHFTLWQGMVRTVRQYTLVGNSDLIPRTHEARWFLTSLDLLGILSITFAFLSMFRPLTYRFRTLPQDRARARQLLDDYGTSSEDIFKLWPEDKSYYFLPGGSSFVAYRVARGVAMCLGEPIGPVEEWLSLLTQFKQYCRVYDWTPALIYVPKRHLEIFEAAGLRPLKIGADAVVDVAHFRSHVARNKHFRAVRNKFSRLGYRFEVSDPPQSRELLLAAGAVTRSWLGVDGRKERGFGMGYHDTDYLRGSPIYTLYDKTNRLTAFANGVRSYHPQQATIDLMRYVKDAETGTMDMLLYSILMQLAADEVKQFSLGLAPLAGIRDTGQNTVEERVLRYVGRIGLGGVSYEGLRRFKSKFEPEWEDRYLVYERGPVGLAWAAASISEVMSGS